MTMTREEALTIVTSIVREHSRECREPKPCQDCELEAEAIAALSAQEPVAYIAQCELDSLIDYRNAGRKAHGLLWSEPTGQAGVPLYAAPPAQAEPLRVTREALEDAANAIIEDDITFERTASESMLAAMHQLGAKVEVSDG